MAKKHSEVEAEFAAQLRKSSEGQATPGFMTEHDAPAYVRTLEFKNLRYDYDTIVDENLRYQIKDAAADIIIRRRNAAHDMIAIGQRLIEVEELLPTSFDKWCETEFQYSSVTARDFMNVAHRFADNPTILLGITPTIVRVLGSPSLPDEGVDKILEVAKERAKEGDKLTVAEAKEIAGDYRPEHAKRPQTRRERIARTIRSNNYTVEPPETPVPAPTGTGFDPIVIETNGNGEGQYEENKQLAISTRKKPGDFLAVSLPRKFWVKLLDALEAFDMDPQITEQEADKISVMIAESIG